jgi:phage terminase small subunit
MPILKNPRHEKFALNFVLCHDAGRSYMQAGYRSSGAAARQGGYLLKQRADVTARISELQAAQFKAMQMENDEILGRLAAAARQDVRRLYREDGTLKSPHELTFEEASMISAIEVQETPGKKATKGEPEIPATIVRKVRLRDNVPALRLLAQHRKLIGTEADEALSNIAAAFADRLANARARRRAEAKGE